MREETIKFRDFYITTDLELNNTEYLALKNEEIIKKLLIDLYNYVNENNIIEFKKESEVFFSKYYNGEVLKHETCVLVEIRLKY